MFKLIAGSNHKLPDTAGFLNFLECLPDTFREFFAVEPEVIVTRAPGRLDLMGGIADYSGSMVLQLPIAAATHAALQRRNDSLIKIVSLDSNETASSRAFIMDINKFGAPDEPVAYDDARTLFVADSAQHWAAYVAGAFLALMRERGAVFQQGANILIHSDVPEGKGVSSSAAIEVAVMQAIAVAYDIPLQPREVAFLCQKVENLIAGAPCGVMDQMTSVCGEADRLLALLCQPAQLLEPVRLPDELAVWGIDSGIKHAVSGADYGTVRTAAFMGYRIIADLAGLNSQVTAPGRVQVSDSRFGGYLANISPEEFAAEFAARLPEQISGAEFLTRYQGITDYATTVQPERSYMVFQATQHPVFENARVQRFAEILRNWQGESDAKLLGELMYQSHDSYSACGLGSEGTDRIVRQVREAGPQAGLFGAKITGGGSGGTVAVLGRRDARETVREISTRYAEQNASSPLVLTGSSPGASIFGHLRLVREEKS